jgi:pectate lyase
VFLSALLAASIGTSGCIGVGSSAANSNTVPPAPTSAVLHVTPSIVSVATMVGNTGSQTVTATNPGQASVAINQIAVSGAGFSTKGLAFPANIAPGASQSFAVAFAATTPGTAVGSLSIMTSASASPVVVQLSATATSSGSTPPPGTGVTSVSINPASATATPSGSIPFAATVQGTTTNSAVTWAATSGTITSAGVYTAPSAAGTATVTATSVADTTKSASAIVTVSASSASGVSSVSISPASPSATTDGTLQFSAAVQGTASNKSVTWIAQRGSISSAGAYVAPSSAGADTVTATSVADTSKFATSTVTVSTPVASGALPAFPGAQGGGAASAGGRGGQVFEVTNLNDSGSGSLRACTSASGPRTCIFRVAGLISPSDKFTISNPFLTIACQTAPGEVIIGGPNGNGSIFITTHDVTMRYCTVSADNINVPAGPDTGTVNIEIANGDNYNIIFDHVTSRWAGNKLWITVSNYVGPNRLITTQWSLFYEPNANHPVGPGNGTNPNCVATSSSPCFSSGERDIDFHHNFFADISHRIPESTNHSTRFVNNLIFNWNFYASEWLGAMTVDEIGNKYVAGNLNFEAAQKHEIHFTTLSPPLPGNPSTYLSGNIGPNLSDPSGNQYLMAAEIDGENGDETGAIPSAWIRSSPMAAPAFPIAADPVGNLDSILLPTVGNSQHLDCNGNWISHRDAADSRIVNQYKTGGSGGYWPNGLIAGVSSLPTPSSSWTDRPVTNFSACTESLHDGIPDQWKTSQGLSTSDPNLYKSTAPNGYTYLENYINGPQ